MLNLSLAMVILAVSLPGILFAVPKSSREMSATLFAKLPAGRSLPPKPVLVAVQIVQSIVLVGGLSMLGALLAPKVGLGAPFFSALAEGSGIVASLPNPLPVIDLSAAGSAVFLVLYYAVFRRWMDEETATAMDRLRNRIGMGARILYGGIVEEVIMRWGMMSPLTWLFSFILGPVASVWVAIVIAGVIFGLGHIPSYVGARCRKGIPFVTTQIVLNLWAGLVFGFLFWRYGLLSAMVSHMLFHLIWYPIDHARLRRNEPADLAEAA